MSGYESSSALFALLVVLVVFLICRELICWYWKLNAIVANQKQQSETLKSILEEIKKLSPKAEPAPEVKTDSRPFPPPGFGPKA
jgi:ABC-type transport system involved in cytochrome bd biosynthesis fused ATPase/permease subunit